MKRIFIFLSYVYLEMRGRRRIYEGRENSRRDEAEESLIYISVFQRGEEKVLFAKIIGGVSEIVVGQCHACEGEVIHLGIPGTPYFQCLACGAVCKEREIVRESIRRWWI